MTVKRTVRVKKFEKVFNFFEIKTIDHKNYMFEKWTSQLNICHKQKNVSLLRPLHFLQISLARKLFVENKTGLRSCIEIPYNFTLMPFLGGGGVGGPPRLYKDSDGGLKC